MKEIKESKIIISVVMITYGHEKFIREAINGVLSQEVDVPIELIISDDRSPDETEAVVNSILEIDPKANIIKYVRQEKNLGMMRNFFWALQEARGKYIAYCEGDDVWIESDKLKKQYEFLEKNTDYSFCSHAVNRIDENSNILVHGCVSNESVTFDRTEIFHNFFPTLSLVFRNIDFTCEKKFHNVYNGDTVLTALLSSVGKAAHLNFLGANYRVHSGGVYRGVSYIKNAEKSIRTREIMLESGVFDDWQEKEIKLELFIRKRKLILYCLKRLKLKSLLTVITNRAAV